MRQILLQVSVYLFHTFILMNNKIGENLKLRFYGAWNEPNIDFTGIHGVNYSFSIKSSLKQDQDEISFGQFWKYYP